LKRKDNVKVMRNPSNKTVEKAYNPLYLIFIPGSRISEEGRIMKKALAIGLWWRFSA